MHAYPWQLQKSDAAATMITVREADHFFHDQLTGLGCECSSSTELVLQASACVLSACTNFVDAFAVLTGASKVCNCVATAVPAARQQLESIAIATGAALGADMRAEPTPVMAKRRHGGVPAPTPVR